MDEKMKIEEQPERYGEAPLVQSNVKKPKTKGSWKSYITGVVLGIALAAGGKAALDQRAECPPPAAKPVAEMAQKEEQPWRADFIKPGEGGDGTGFHKVISEADITDADWEIYVYQMSHMATEVARTFIDMKESDLEKFKIMSDLYFTGRAPVFVDARLYEIDEQELKKGGIEFLDDLDTEPFTYIPIGVDDKEWDKINKEFKLTNEDWQAFIDYYSNLSNTAIRIERLSDPEKLTVMSKMFGEGRAPEWVHEEVDERVKENVGQMKQATKAEGSQRTRIIDRLRDNRAERQGRTQN